MSYLTDLYGFLCGIIRMHIIIYLQYQLMMKTTSIVLLLALVFAVHTATTAEKSANSNNLLVSYSTFFSTGDYVLYKLDSSQAFSFQLNDNFQWIQTTSQNPHWWTAVITQGRANDNQWVTRFRVSYTRDGNIWKWVDGGRQFIGNYDRNTKVRNNFDKPVYGKAIRIHVTAFTNWSSLRFDAIYQ